VEAGPRAAQAAAEAEALRVEGGGDEGDEVGEREDVDEDEDNEMHT
jgi:hypothetical protein